MDWPLVDCYCWSNHTHRGTQAHGDMSAHTAVLGGSFAWARGRWPECVVQTCWNPHNTQCDFIGNFKGPTLVLTFLRLLACNALRPWPLSKSADLNELIVCHISLSPTTNMLLWELQPKYQYSESKMLLVIHLLDTSILCNATAHCSCTISAVWGDRVNAAFMSHCSR